MNAGTAPPGNQDRGWDNTGMNSFARTLRKLQFLLIADALGSSAGSTRFFLWPL
jgi:hypothetical protein